MRVRYAIVGMVCLALVAVGCSDGGGKGIFDGPVPQALLFVPQDYDPGQDWPLILFVHGLFGDDPFSLQGPMLYADQHPDFPFIVVQPLSAMGFDVAMLMQTLDETRAEYSVDPDRVYVTGLSSGGRNSWEIAIEHPEAIAAVAPVCGDADPDSLDVCRMVDVPAWAFHNEGDPLTPISEAQAMVDALTACGGDATLTAYPTGGHDAWTATYQNPGLYAWFLSHSKR